MTKQKMIDIILEEKEMLWRKLHSTEDIYVRIAIRNQWYAINRLCCKLNIEI